MMECYTALFTAVLIVLGVLLFLCMIRAIRGPRIADRLIGINMTGTIVIMMIAILAVLQNEGYLIDVAIIYALLSFLAVVILVKVFIGVYLEEKETKKKAKKDV